MNNIQISKNFKLKEFQCKDGSQLVKIDSQLLYKLQALRDEIGRPVIINSGYRTESHNKAVGGAQNSYHMQGKAVDIRVNGLKPEEIAKIAEKIGFTGIGIYKNFTHVDIRPVKTKWYG